MRVGEVFEVSSTRNTEYNTHGVIHFYICTYQFYKYQNRKEQSQRFTPDIAAQDVT